MAVRNIRAIENNVVGINNSTVEGIENICAVLAERSNDSKAVVCVVVDMDGKIEAMLAGRLPSTEVIGLLELTKSRLMDGMLVGQEPLEE
jgi:hypothetical protein